MKISIIIPVHNEEQRISRVLNEVNKLAFGFPKEIILIDDGSTDQSKKYIEDYLSNSKNENNGFKLISKTNGGKGSAIRRGFLESTGDIITIQDADFEYNPSDLKVLANVLITGNHEVVYGSRFIKKTAPNSGVYFFGNKVLTSLTNLLFHSNLTDMETCYKMFKKDIINGLELRSNGFNIEPEITAKILKKRIKIKEVPIGYSPRSVAEGKKIGWKDGAVAVWTLLSLKILL